MPKLRDPSTWALMRFAVLAVAIALISYGAYYGLVVAPPEAMMGDVGRILYVHVPAAWIALVAFTISFAASVGWLWKRSWKMDALAEAATEVGVFFNVLLLGLGMLWARPTWGVYWTWDPRLTSAAIMCFAFAAYLGLRQFVDDPERRATFTAVYIVFASASLPLVWFSVRWFRSLHQVQSSPATMDHAMVIGLRINAFAFLGFMIFFIWERYLMAMKRTQSELAQ